MMVKLAFGLALLLGSGVDELTPVRYKTLSIHVPGGWHRSDENGSLRYASPTKEATFILSVSKVQTSGMKADVCRQKILANMGEPESNWTLLEVGGEPAARKLDVDEAKGGEIHTLTFVGCNGVTTWTLVFHLDARAKKRFTPLAERMVRSLGYLPPDVTE